MLTKTRAYTTLTVALLERTIVTNIMQHSMRDAAPVSVSKFSQITRIHGKQQNTLYSDAVYQFSAGQQIVLAARLVFSIPHQMFFSQTCTAQTSLKFQFCGHHVLGSYFFLISFAFLPWVYLCDSRIETDPKLGWQSVMWDNY